MKNPSQLVNTVYSACSCNNGANTLDWGRNSLVIYGSSTAVVICNLTDPVGKVTTLCRHRDTVRSVKWVKENDGSDETEFLSTSVDKTVVLWSFAQDTTYHPSAVLEHGEIVHTADGMYISERKTTVSKQAMIVASGSNSFLKIWKREDNEDSFSSIQTLCFGSYFSLCVRLHRLENPSTILLACASDRGKVHLFIEEDLHFTSIFTMDGHADFVWSLDIATTDEGNLSLVSGSQDSTILVWGLYRYNESDDGDKHHLKKNEVSIRGQRFYIEVESTILSHKRAVHGVCWYPAQFSKSGKKLHQPMTFVSASLENVGILFSLNELTGTWSEVTHLGNGILDDSTLGSRGCKFSPDGSYVVFHGFHGSLCLWKVNFEKSDSKKSLSTWNSVATLGGHFGAVVDLQWDPRGEFLISASKDQTARIHAPLKTSEDLGTIHWRQIAWSQVHGYDLSCLAVLSRFVYACGSDEKVIRIYEAPLYFVESVQNISISKDTEVSRNDRKENPYCAVQDGSKNQTKSEENEFSLSTSAIRSSLGLLNKPVYNPRNMHQRTHVERKEFSGEDFLRLRTLWSEVHKLYGHGNEISALAVHPSEKLLASACRATTPADATIILWKTDNWNKYQELESHTLTVTRMAFSPDGQFLVSVSRDRRWSLFKSCKLTDQMYELVASTESKNGVHTRIIWTCGWSHDSLYFATGSRDGKVAVWQSSSDTLTPSSVIVFKGEPVKAVALAPSLIGDNYIIAIGFESGLISIYAWNPNSKIWKELVQLDKNLGHHLSVKQLSFRPSDAGWLASCGEDNFVKIFDLTLVYKSLL